MLTKSLKAAVLITISGHDGPGITSEFMGILAMGGVPILDIGQAVVNNLLSLSILFEIDSKSDKASQSIIKDLLFKATEMGLKLEFRVLDRSEIESGHHLHAARDEYVITLIADPITADAVHRVTKVLALFQLNIDSIERLSEGEFGCLELMVSASDSKNSEKLIIGSLKEQLLAVAQSSQVDIAVQAEGLYRRTKRLIVLDMDSTLIQSEIIDELAREVGAYEAVAKITREAMSGGLPFDESLRKRCAHLAGLKLDQLEAVYQRTELTPGAEQMIRVLKKVGYKVALISGGFTFVADRLRDRLGLDYCYANQLEIQSGKVTGNVIPPIVNAQRKSDLLDVIAQQERIHLEQVVAVGDGANDLLMLQKAGLGIAFNAKPVVRESADASINQRKLSSILYLLGISTKDLSAIE
ncbi:MAG: phosphoserine phosphatase SerB [Bdellovibrionota bacterium]